MENIEKRFNSFQNDLREHALKSGVAELDELKELKRNNEVLELKTILLDQQVRALQASMSFIQTLEAKGKVAENDIGFNSIRQNVDEIIREVLCHIIQKIDGDFMSDLMSKSLVDVNNNSSIERKNSKKFKKRTEQQVETRLTRSKRKTSGGSLLNPRKFYACLICGEKHMDYSPVLLKSHYRVSHGYELGTGPLPVTISQLEEKAHTDCQQSTKCHICGTNFKTLETLILHKSLHVNPKFCRYKCSKSDCTEAFVLKEQLQNHEKVYHQNTDRE